MFDAPHVYYLIFFFFLKKDPNIDTRFIYAARITSVYYEHYTAMVVFVYLESGGGVEKKIINELFIDESSRSFSAHNVRRPAIAVDLRRETERREKTERIGKSRTEISCTIIYG